MMTTRANYFALGADAMNILMQQENYLRTQFDQPASLGTPLWELIKIRVSQINQCAFCIDMHTHDALQQGETAERIVALNAWRDMPMYSDSERAALAWAEHQTAGLAVDDECYHSAVTALGEQALVDLTIAINAINSWNRVAKTFKPEVGCFRK